MQPPMNADERRQNQRQDTDAKEEESRKAALYAMMKVSFAPLRLCVEGVSFSHWRLSVFIGGFRNRHLNLKQEGA
jgi:hypothetical protein